MKQDKFLVEIEERLIENRRLAEKSWVPDFLKPLVTYLGFNTFRALFVVSLIVTIVGVWYLFDDMVHWGEHLFFLL